MSFAYTPTAPEVRRRLPSPLGGAPGIPGSEVLNRSGSKPFRITVKRNLPAGQVYRPGFLRRSLAYVANGDLPPVLAFVWPAREPWIPPPPPVKRRPAAKRTLADPGNRAGNVPENQPQNAVSCHRTRRHNAVMSASADTALRASLAACCIIFAACAGWAVVL